MTFPHGLQACAEKGKKAKRCYKMENKIECKITDKYALYNGDSCEVIKSIPDNSIGLSVFSPPFANLYIYSDDLRDMGNCRDSDEFFEQMDYLTPELYRIMQPGRLIAVHCKQLARYKGKDGASGWYDFRGDIIRHYEKHGFQYHSEVVIWTDPVLEMQKTKTQRLLYCQLQRDASLTGIGMPEYLCLFRKWDGDETLHEPVRHYKTEKDAPDETQVIDLPMWQKYASPVWFDIKRTDVLNANVAMNDKDEKHLCFAKGTLILTKRGYVPIEEIIPGEDEVLTNSATWQKVIAKALTARDAKVIRTKAIGVPNLISTPSHKIMAKEVVGGWLKKDRLKLIKADWKEAKSLNDRCYVKSVLPPVTESKISAQEWWIIGRWLADGHLDSRGHQFIISVGNSKWEEFQKKADGYIGCVFEHEDNHCKQVGIKGLSSASREVLFKCGKGAGNKRLPVECISLNEELSKALFDGYMSGDGHVTKDGCIMITSVSRALLLGMAIVAEKATGKVASIHRGRDEKIHTIKQRSVHSKTEWIMTIRNKYSWCKKEQDSTWKKVKGTEDCGISEVYSLEVENDHSYVAEGCVVKNCPLQREVIRRAVKLWSNPGDIVFSPFGGIGSEPYIALEQKRRAIAIELKPEYYRQMVINCESIVNAGQVTMFDEE